MCNIAALSDNTTTIHKATTLIENETFTKTVAVDAFAWGVMSFFLAYLKCLLLWFTEMLIEESLTMLNESTKFKINSTINADFQNVYKKGLQLGQFPLR